MSGCLCSSKFSAEPLQIVLYILDERIKPQVLKLFADKKYEAQVIEKGSLKI